MSKENEQVKDGAVWRVQGEVLSVRTIPGRPGQDGKRDIPAKEAFQVGYMGGSYTVELLPNDVAMLPEGRMPKVGDRVRVTGTFVERNWRVYLNGPRIQFL